MVHDHNFGPTFERNALKHVEEGPENVVKVGDIIVRVKRLFTAIVACRAGLIATDDFFTLIIE